MILLRGGQRYLRWVPPVASSLLVCVAVCGWAAPGDEHWWGGFVGAGRIPGVVNELTTYGGKVIAGGEFAVAGDTTLVENIATWNGWEWERLGRGLRHIPCPDVECRPFAQAVGHYGSDLIAGGRFDQAGDLPANNIARWDGTSWHPLGSGTNQVVWAVVEYHGDLIVGGNFTEAGGAPANFIARWDGSSWWPMGNGLSNTVVDLVVYGDTLVAGGSFAGGAAAWNGSEWRSMLWGYHPWITDFAIFDGNLVACGDFQESVGSLDFQLARWTGNAWVEIPIEFEYGWPSDVKVYRGELVVSCDDGSVRRLRENVWSSLGTPSNDMVLALCPTDTSLFVGGRFTEIGGKPSYSMGRWDDRLTPVLVEDLAAWELDGTVRITWRLAREALPTLRLIAVERSFAAAGPFENRSGSGLLPEREMSFTDTDLVGATTLWYRLLVQGKDGAITPVGPVATAGESGSLSSTLDVPSISADGQPIRVRYRLGPNAGRIDLAVFSVQGRLVRTLNRGLETPGDHVYYWDGRSEAGDPVSRGIYFVRLVADRTLSKKVLVTHR